MPTFRSDIDSIQPYEPGKPIEDVMREFGLDDIIKLASNECPEDTFAPVQEAIAAAAHEVNRYPDNAAHVLTNAIADFHDVAPQNVWVGPGSSSILIAISSAVGGTGTSAVFSELSFMLYQIITNMAQSGSIAVPIDDELRIDAPALAAAVRDDTTVMYVANPNNPTGTYLEPAVIDRLVAAAPEHVLVVLDEAYEEYVSHPDHRTALPHALERSNVVVLRTFSKIYGLAGLRVGYAIGQAETLGKLRRFQAPFAVSNVAQAAAIEALRHQDLVAARAKDNARGLDQLSAGFTRLGVNFAPSECNFIFMGPMDDPSELCERLLRRGVIVRQFGERVRVTVGTESENARFLDTLGELL